MATTNELIFEYIEHFEESFPIYEAVQDEVELAKRIQECLDKNKRYTELYPIDPGVVY